MASASSFLSEEQFLCSICLDVFTEPVSIPCGHNFCKACITRHWEGKEQCQCPLCNNKFNKGLKICINTAFREVVENFKKHHQETLCDNNDFLVKPGLVECDYCLDKKVKASKTCLVCLASFCELHLEPHLRVDTLRRHQLTEPVQNLEDKICKNHNRILERFCRTDLICICVLCTDHSAHDTVPLEKAYVNKKAQMGKKKAEQKSGKKAQKMKAPMQTKKKDKDDGASNQTQASHIWWFPTEGPHEFNRYSYVPGNRCVSEAGSCYEIQLNGGTNWDLGVITESMGGESPVLPIHGNGMGIIKLERNSSCKALQNDPIHLYLIKKPERVLVFVECESKLLSFYDPYLNIMSYSLTGPKFSKRILLFLFPCPTECVSWAQRLRKKVQKIKAWSQRPDNLCYCIVTVCVLLLSVLIEFK